MSNTILAIDSSCDETAASVCVDGKILSNYIANQKVHEQYGGVVPELASRAHMQNIVPVVEAAIKTASENLQSEIFNLQINRCFRIYSISGFDWFIISGSPVCKIIIPCIKQTFDRSAPYAGACIGKPYC